MRCHVMLMLTQSGTMSTCQHLRLSIAALQAYDGFDREIKGFFKADS